MEIVSDWNKRFRCRLAMRMISIVLVASFFVYDILWAYPDKLQISTLITRKDDIGKLKFFLADIIKREARKEQPVSVKDISKDIISEIDQSCRALFSKKGDPLRDTENSAAYMVPCEIKGNHYYAYITQNPHSFNFVISIYTQEEFNSGGARKHKPDPERTKIYEAGRSKNLSKEELEYEEVAKLMADHITDTDSLSNYIDKLTGGKTLIEVFMLLEGHNSQLMEQYQKAFLEPLFRFLFHKLKNEFRNTEPFITLAQNIMREEGAYSLWKKMGEENHSQLREKFYEISRGKNDVNRCVSISLYGLLLFCLTSRSTVEAYLSHLYDIVVGSRPIDSIGWAIKGRSYSARSHMITNYYDRVLIYEGSDPLYVKRINPRYGEIPFKKDTSGKDNVKVIKALSLLERKAATLGKEGKDIKGRVDRFREHSAVVELMMHTRVLFSDTENMVVRMMHGARDRWILFLPEPYVHRLSKDSDYDMKGLAILLNAFQRFVDMVSELVNKGASYSDVQKAVSEFNLHFFEQEDSQLMTRREFKKMLADLMKENTIIRYRDLMWNVIQSEEDASILVRDGLRQEDFGRAIDMYGRIMYRYEGMGLHSRAEKTYAKMKEASDILQARFYGHLPIKKHMDTIFAALRFEQWESFIFELHKLLRGDGYSRNMTVSEVGLARDVYLTPSSPDNMARNTFEDHLMQALHAHVNAATPDTIDKIQKIEADVRELLKKYFACPFANLTPDDIDIEPPERQRQDGTVQMGKKDYKNIIVRARKYIMEKGASFSPRQRAEMLKKMLEEKGALPAHADIPEHLKPKLVRHNKHYFVVTDEFILDVYPEGMGEEMPSKLADRYILNLRDHGDIPLAKNYYGYKTDEWHEVAGDDLAEIEEKDVRSMLDMLKIKDDLAENKIYGEDIYDWLYKKGLVYKSKFIPIGRDINSVTIEELVEDAIRPPAFSPPISFRLGRLRALVEHGEATPEERKEANSFLNSQTSGEPINADKLKNLVVRIYRRLIEEDLKKHGKVFGEIDRADIKNLYETPIFILKEGRAIDADSFSLVKDGSEAGDAIKKYFDPNVKKYSLKDLGLPSPENQPSLFDFDENEGGTNSDQAIEERRNLIVNSEWYKLLKAEIVHLRLNARFIEHVVIPCLLTAKDPQGTAEAMRDLIMSLKISLRGSSVFNKYIERILCGAAWSRDPEGTSYLFSKFAKSLHSADVPNIEIVSIFSLIIQKRLEDYSRLISSLIDTSELLKREGCTLTEIGRAMEIILSYESVDVPENAKELFKKDIFFICHSIIKFLTDIGADKRAIKNLVLAISKTSNPSGFVKALEPFFLSERNFVLASEKVRMITSLLNLAPNLKNLELVIGIYNGTKRYYKLKFARLAANMLSILPKDLMTEGNSDDNWRILLEDYTRDFGLVADPDLILIHRYLSLGMAIDSRELGAYRLRELGIEDTGRKGIEQLKGLINNLRIDIFEKKDIEERYLENPVIRSLAGTITGFSTSSWGKSEIAFYRDLRDIAREFHSHGIDWKPVPQELKDLRLPPFTIDSASHNNLEGADLKSLKNRIEWYRGIIARAAEDMPSQKETLLLLLKKNAGSAVSEELGHLSNNKLAVSPGVAATNIEIQIEYLRKALTEIEGAGSVMELNIILTRNVDNVVKRNGMLKQIINTSLIAEAMRRFPDLKDKLLDLIHGDVSYSLMSDFVEALNMLKVKLSEGVLKDIDRRLAKEMLDKIEIGIFRDAQARLSSANDKLTLYPFIDKGLLAMLLAYRVDNCLTIEKSIMANENMLGALLFMETDGEAGDIAGGLYILENSIKGKKVWILRAVNLREPLPYSYDSCEFVKGAVDSAKKLAEAYNRKHPDSPVSYIVAPVDANFKISEADPIRDAFGKIATGGLVKLDKLEDDLGGGNIQNSCKVVAVPDRPNSGLPGIEYLIKLHEKLIDSGTVTKLKKEGRKLLFSENLFRPEDRNSLRAIFSQDIIEILPADKIYSLSTNRDTQEGKLGCIVTRDDFETHWKSSAVSANKASILVVDMDQGIDSYDRDYAYVYLEGLISLISSILNKDSANIKIYLDLLFDTGKINQEALAEFLKDNDSIKFASNLNSVLKFKPAEKIDINRFDEYKKNIDMLREAA